MAAKIVIIERCDQCPYFDDSYWDYNEFCMELKRKIAKIENMYPIPEDCPLKDANEQA